MFYDRGGSRIFSRGGGADFQKILTTFFEVDQIDFLSSPKARFCPYFGQIFCAAGKFLKKEQAKKGVFRHFWKILTEKLRFFGARSHSKLVNIGAKDSFRKILGSVGQKWSS